MKYLSKSLTDTRNIAQKFLAELSSTPQGATIVGLHGDLGAGKTAFTQAVAQILGVQDVVTSPTFIIEKLYKLDDKHFDQLIHIDAYRLESGKELADLGWREIAENPKNLILIEWPEKVAEILPADMKKIQFTFIDEHTREIEFQNSKYL
jgi:tRNA threonylcarbamoyladenosine biosynthesis protein TsaE